MTASESRIKEIVWAYEEMQKRRWGFASNGHGFGDPAATMTGVGPIKDGIVEVWGMDPDCVQAVKNAIIKEKSTAGLKTPKEKDI